MKNRYILLLDLLLLPAAAIGAFVLRFNWTFANTRDEAILYIAAVVLIKPIVFGLFGLYHRYWRYVSVFDLVLISVGVTVASLVMGTIVALAVSMGFVAEFSRAVLVDDWFLTLLAAAGLRLSVRLMAEASQGSPVGPRRVLIVGAGEAGMLAVREIRKNRQLRLQPVGYLDDDPQKHGKRILGLPVAGDLDQFAKAVALLRVEEVVIAMPKASGAVVRRATDAARALGLQPRVMPGVYELLDGASPGARLREIEISDLLRRDPVSPTPQSIAYLLDHVVLVTGAGGSIGSELCRQVGMAGAKKLILLGHGENSIFAIERQLNGLFPGLPVVPVIADIRDAERLKALFAETRPSIVFHAAAHKHVPLMECNPIEAITNNVLGTLNVVRACRAAGVERLVSISTDKAVAPSSVMGASKRVSEFIVRDYAARHSLNYCCVRFGNVLGSRGSVVETFKQQIAAGGPLTITDPEMRRFFMTIPEAVHLVVEAGGLGRPGGVFVLNMGQPVRIVDLAQDLIALSGLRPEQVPVHFSGMRPGEKLMEALFEENAAVTEVTPDIMRVVEPNDPSSSQLELVLAEAARLGPTDNAQSIDLLRRIVPTFISPSLPVKLESDAR